MKQFDVDRLLQMVSVNYVHVHLPEDYIKDELAQLSKIIREKTHIRTATRIYMNISNDNKYFNILYDDIILYRIPYNGRVEESINQFYKEFEDIKKAISDFADNCYKDAYTDNINTLMIILSKYNFLHNVSYTTKFDLAGHVKVTIFCYHVEVNTFYVSRIRKMTYNEIEDLVSQVIEYVYVHTIHAYICTTAELSDNTYQVLTDAAFDRNLARTYHLNKYMNKYFRVGSYNDIVTCLDGHISKTDMDTLKKKHKI